MGIKRSPEMKGEEKEWEKVSGGWVYRVASGWWRAYDAKDGCDHGPYQTREYAVSQVRKS